MEYGQDPYATQPPDIFVNIELQECHPPLRGEPQDDTSRKRLERYKRFTGQLQRVRVTLPPDEYTHDP